MNKNENKTKRITVRVTKEEYNMLLTIDKNISKAVRVVIHKVLHNENIYY